MRKARTLTRGWVWGVIAAVLLSAAAFCIGEASPGAHPDSVATEEDRAVTIDVLTNDDGLLALPVAVTLLLAPTNGGTMLNADNTITYRPNPDFNGVDRFTYQVCDNNGDCSSAAVEVTVESVNDAPQAVDDRVTSPQDTPVSLTFQAFDIDLDPVFPQNHPLTFALLEGPGHGTITGDLYAVLYRPLHTGFVEVTYIPAAGFVGADSITFSVTDIVGASAYGVVRVDIGQRPPVIGVLWGTWEMVTTLSEQTPALTVDSTLHCFYRIGTVCLQGAVGWASFSYSPLSFTIDTPLGEEVAITSTLVFDVNGSCFDYWKNTVSFSMLGVRVMHITYLPHDIVSAYYQIVADWSWDHLTFTSRSRFKGMQFAFDEEELRVSREWRTYGSKIDAELTLDDEAGFDHFSLAIRGVPILYLDHGNLGIDLSLETTWTLSGKTLSAVFTCESEWIDCLKLLYEAVEGEVPLPDISLYGMQLQTTFSEGIALAIDASFVEEQNALVTGYSKYCEVWKLSAPILSSYTVPGRWQVATYFQSGSSAIFDWGLTTFTLDLALISQFTVSLEVRTSSEIPYWRFTLGWKLSW